jgi:O-antigen/teichoic acid export membrane protein
MSTDLVAPLAPVSSARSRLHTGIFFNLLGAVFNQGSTFAFNIIAANVLGRQTFGEYAVIQSTLVALSQVAQLACGYTATKYIAEFRSTNKPRAGQIVGMLLTTTVLAAGIVACSLLVCAPWMASSILKAPQLKLGLEITAGVVFFCVINGFLVGALAGFEAYSQLARVFVLSGTFYLVACTVFARAYGLTGAVSGLLASAAGQWVLLQRALKSECAKQGIQIRYLYFKKEQSILLRFTLPAAMSGLTSMPALWIGNAILGRRSDGYLQVALFSAVYTLMSLVLFVPNISNIVGMSLLNHQKGRGQLSDYRQTFWINFRFTAVIVLAGAALLTFLGPLLLRMFGKGFVDGYPVLLIMMVATIPQGLSIAVYQIIQSQGQMWLSFWGIALPRDVMLVSAAYVLTRRYGAAGLACDYTVAWTIAFVATTAIAYRMHLKPAESNA